MFDVTTDERSQVQIELLPMHAVALFEQVLAVLEIAPWTAGAPYHPHRPDSPMRAIRFGDGRGDVVYLIVDDVRRVDLLVVLWLE